MFCYIQVIMLQLQEYYEIRSLASPAGVCSIYLPVCVHDTNIIYPRNTELASVTEVCSDLYLLFQLRTYNNTAPGCNAFWRSINGRPENKDLLATKSTYTLIEKPAVGHVRRVNALTTSEVNTIVAGLEEDVSCCEYIISQLWTALMNTIRAALHKSLTRYTSYD